MCNDICSRYAFARVSKWSGPAQNKWAAIERAPMKICTRISTRVWLFLLAGAFILCAPAALADTASMYLTGVGPNGSMGGVYIGPYVAQVNGVSTPVVCDDFADESYLNESWTANVFTFANLSGTKWAGLANSTTLYEEAAWLTDQLANAPQPEAGDIQFAIWAIFDPSALNSLSSSQQTDVEKWISMAQNQTFTPGEFANILIYTPDINDPILCDGASCANTPPQEFMVVTPEPSELGLLLIGLMAITIGISRKNAACRIA
jgi:hypothetical protein